MTKIQWTNKSWNPIAGCSKVSEGCRNCYAMHLAWRLGHNPKVADKYAGTAFRDKHGENKSKVRWTGYITFDEKALQIPLKEKKPTRYFANSMSDLFHQNVTDDVIDQIFAVMSLCPHHTFQILTKRPGRMQDYLKNYHRKVEWLKAAQQLDGQGKLKKGILFTLKEPLPNVWLGVSVEDQKTANERIPILLDTQAAIRWISAEPLLGPVDLTKITWGDDFIWACTDALSGVDTCLEFPGEPRPSKSKLDWVVAGGESGKDARPMHPDWARSLRDQCQAAGVPFFFKQWGGWAPIIKDNRHLLLLLTKKRCRHFGDGTTMYLAGKKAAGSLLDGRTHLEFPETDQ